MATYLLVWNPKRKGWEELPDEASLVKDGEPQTMSWSCGVTKRIRRDDRVFLIKLGDEPRCIFGSGTVVKGSYEGKHWMEDKAKLGKKAWYIKAKFETLLDPNKDKILLRKQLDKAPLAGVNWSTQSSGITIPDEIAVKLEEVWAKLINTKKRHVSFIKQLLSEAEVIACDNFDFQKPTRKITSIFQRVIRDSAVGKTLKNLYEYNCQVCGCTIETQSGKRYAEVHHLRPVGKPHNGKDGKPNTIVVCPQHHAMFDLGVIAINPTTFKIEHWNTSIGEHGTSLSLKHNLDKNNVRYHYRKIFNRKKQ